MSVSERDRRNKRAQDRYDELMREAKHGHYETLFRVVREAVEDEREQCAQVADEHFENLPCGQCAGSTRGENCAQLITAAIRRRTEDDTDDGSLDWKPGLETSDAGRIE